MVLNVLNVPVLWPCYALIILIIVNGTNGAIATPSNQEIMDEIMKIKETLDTMQTNVDRCPLSDGYFIAPGTGQGQCLKVFIDKLRNWAEAKKKCEDENLVLAQPYNALALRNYIFERYSYWHFWIDAKGKDKDSEMIWQTDRDGSEKVGKDNPLWWPAHPGNFITKLYCLQFVTSDVGINENPKNPYLSKDCSVAQHTLCERIM